MNEILTNLSKVLPQLAILAAVFGFIGWSLRGLGIKPTDTKSAKPAPTSEKGQGQERAKNLEAALEKSRASHKALKSEFDQFKVGSVSKDDLEKANAELEAFRKSLESENRRIAALEVELKKAQETNKNLNARANEVDKSQKDRSFALENELSKAREQLAILQNRPDDSAELQSEIERLRESVATTTRFAGELRKREAAAIEALEKAEARLASALESGRDLPEKPKKIGPIPESNRIAAAKAEVIRLVEQNKQKAAEAAPLSDSGAPLEVSGVSLEASGVSLEASGVSLEESGVSLEDSGVSLEDSGVSLEASGVSLEASGVSLEPSGVSLDDSETPVETPSAPVNPEPVAEKKVAATGELFAMD